MIGLIVSRLAQFTADDTGLPTVTANQSQLQNILSLVFAIAGTIAVLIIVIGGFMYVMSSGDPQKTSRAKDAILYAVIGLVISIMSYAIVAFVLGAVT